MNLNILLISVGVVALAGLGVTILFRKHLNERKLKAFVAFELATFLLILVGYICLNPDSWISRMLELSSFPLAIWGLIALFRGKLDSDR